MDSIERIKRYYNFMKAVPDFDTEDRVYAYVAYMAHRLSNDGGDSVNLQDLYMATAQRFLLDRMKEEMLKEEGKTETEKRNAAKVRLAEEVKGSIATLQSKFANLFSSTRMLTEPSLGVIFEEFFHGRIEYVQDTERFIKAIADALAD